VLGAVTAGDLTLDATNDSSGASAGSGGAEALNSAAAFAGLDVASATIVAAADVTSTAADNVQEGDNAGSFAQTAEATSGDAVSGQVAGVVTSAGGSADLVLANTTDGSSGSGFAFFDNTLESFTGLNAGGLILL
jgi:hypothetical protein